MTCVICDRHPAVNGGGICHNCGAKITAAKKKRQVEEPVKYATYRGIVVGFYRNGGGTLVPRLLHRKPENLPKYMTLDLNTYIVGFTREQVKKLKSCILQLASA